MSTSGHLHGEFVRLLTKVSSTSLKHLVMSPVKRNCLSVVADFSYSIAHASASPERRQLPSAWVAILDLLRALFRNRSSPLTQQWTSISLTKTICFLIPLPGFLAPS